MRKLDGRSALGTILAVAIGGISIAACDSSDLSIGPGSTVAGFGNKLATVVCDKLFECCNAADLVEKAGNVQIVDYAGCHLVYNVVWTSGTEAILRDSEAAGRLGFDAAAFNACLGAVGSQSCTDFSANRSVVGCDDAFIPKVEGGGACTNDLECTTGACEIPMNAAEGTCVQASAPSGPNEPCADDDDCETGLYCNTSTCTTKLADGDACSADEQCQSGTCVGDAQTPGQCGTVCEGGGIGKGPTDPVLEGVSGSLVVAQCDKAVECCTPAELGEAILQGVTTKGQCYAISSLYFALALLQIHNAAAEGKVSVDAEAIKACAGARAAQTCQEHSKFTPFECPDGVKGLVADGNACTEHSMCATTYCNEPMPDQGTCAPLPTAGTACIGKCDAGLYCNAGTCAARKATGQACTVDAECLEGRCVGPAGGMGTCSIICDGM